MRTLRVPAGALVVALVLGAALAAVASATPVARTTVECEGASATLVLMHPGGGGKAVWDVSAESVQDAPSYLIKRVEGDVYDPGGTWVGRLDKSVGQKTGLGEPLTCNFEVHWNDGYYVIARLHLVQL